MNNRLKISPITSGYRPIKDGKQYDQFFGLAEDRDRVILQDGEVEDTVDLMKKVVWKYIADTKKIAEYLRAQSLKDTCQNIWEFLYNHIQYKLDEKGLEQLRRPARSWQDRRTGIDCDCFSVFVSSILTNLKIPHKFRITKYEQDNFQHVYVIVPKTDGTYHTIDCVLSRPDYEKPFTAKKDFNMSLNGINVAVLSGAAGRNVMDLVNDLEGLENLGAESQDEKMDAIYHHLIQTRQMINEKPQTISTVDYPPAFIKMLDYAIDNWNTPNRDKALEILAKNEDALNKVNGLEGVSDDEDTDEDWSRLDGLTDDEIIEELGGKSRTEKKEAKKAKKEEKKAKKAADNKTEDGKPKKGFFNKVKEALKKGGKAFIRFNPVTIAARNGFLLAIKLNVKKMASRLKPAYMTPEEAKAAGYTEDQVKKAKEAITKIEKTFVDKLQGKRERLKSAIMKARVKKLNGLSGEDEEFDLGRLGAAPAAAAILAAAIPVIATCVKAMKGSGLMNKGESEDVSAELKAGEEEANGMLDDPDLKDSGEEGSSNRAPEEGTDSAPTGFFGKVIDFAKKNPIVVAAGAGLAIWGIVKLTGKKKTEIKSLEGPPKTTAKKKKKAPAKSRGRKARVERILLK
jgi:hypothetical protein